MHKGKLAFTGAVVLAFGLLAIAVYSYWGFLADDTFISLRYSERLLQGKGLTWSDGQRVEGYTNLLWVLLGAALGRMGMDLVCATRLLGLLCTGCAFAALVVYLRVCIDARRRPLAAMCALVPFSLSACVAVWTVGGLEQPLLSALLAWTLVALACYWQRRDTRYLAIASVLMALMTLTRADGFLFPLLVALSLSLLPRPGASTREDRVKSAGLALLAPTLAYGGQLTFRRLYYHDWLPNTAYVKVSFTLHRLLTGLRYVSVGVVSEIALVALASLGCWNLWRSRERRGLALIFALLTAGPIFYLILVGGDIFPAIRHFMPVIVVLCFAAASAPEFGKAADSAGYRRPLLLMLCAVATVLSRRQARAALLERWEWQNRELGLYLKQHLRPDALIVADAAGAIPFYSQLDAIDPLGLCDYHIAHYGSASKGRGLIGHELGDGRYVLDHRPDVIIFGPTGVARPMFGSDEQIAQDPRFRENYDLRQLRFAVPKTFTSAVYVRHGVALQ